MSDGPSHSQERLLITIRPLVNHMLAVLSGEIDFSTHARLEDELGTALSTTTSALIIDLSEVAFCDSSGLNTLARLQREARARGVSIILVGLQGRVAHVLAMTRLDSVFYRQPDLQTAIRWLETGSAATPDEPPTVA